MRAVFRLAVLLAPAVVAGPALAQPHPPRPAPPPPLIVGAPAASLGVLQGQQAILQSQHDLAASQAIAQRNEFSRLDAQMRTEQNLASLQALSQPAPPIGSDAAYVDASGLVSIPDSALAASNARVRAAAGDQP